MKMTINQLRQYRKLKGRKLLLEAERDELILKANAVDGIGGRTNKTSDTVAQTVIEREKKQRDIDNLERRLKAVEAYIDSCDEYFGTMLKMHYIDGKTWTAIAIRQGGGNTKDSVRISCHRYVKSNP